MQQHFFLSTIGLSVSAATAIFVLNSKKMSKSHREPPIKTLEDAVNKQHSSHATRFALADAGDGVDDAISVTETANSAVMRLYKRNFVDGRGYCC